jgi:D-amino-acid dehydrogenase
MDVLVIGAGIVGLACAHALVRDGHSVRLLDRAPDGDKCSRGNAAAIGVAEVVPASVPGLLWQVPGWLIDPLGPLSIRPAHAPRLLPWLWRFLRAGQAAEVPRIAQAIAALNLRAHDDHVPMLCDIGLADDLHRVGSLVVYTSGAGFAREREEWALRRRLGVECREMTGDEARELEPALAPIVRHAVLTPQSSHVSDPARIVDHLLAWLRARQVPVIAGEGRSISLGDGRPSVVTADGSTLDAEVVVIAAGAWSGGLAAQLGDRVLLESERGYNTTLPRPGIRLCRQIVFAERKFVATPLSIGLRIGGAAEFAGLYAAPNYARSGALLELARPYLPGIDATDGQVWMGNRPATPDSLPVIGRSPRSDRVLYAFGHGHLGLTQSATTARLISDMVGGRPPVVELAPYRIERFA